MVVQSVVVCVTKRSLHAVTATVVTWVVVRRALHVTTILCTSIGKFLGTCMCMNIHNQLLSNFGSPVVALCESESMFAEMHALLSEDVLYVSHLHHTANNLRQCDGTISSPQSWRRYSIYVQIMLSLCSGRTCCK